MVSVLRSYNPNSESQSKASDTFEDVAVPNAAPEQLTATSCWMRYLHLVNTTVGALVVTVVDGAGVYFLKTSLAAGAVYDWEGAHWCQGGVSWQSAGDGVSGQMRVQY